MALLLQRIEREHDVVRGDRRSISELGFGPDLERHRHVVVGDIARLRDKAVDRIGLVVGAHHEAVENQLRALRGVSLENEVVEAVERRDAAWSRPATRARPWARWD